MLTRLWSVTALFTTASALAQSPCSPFAARVYDAGPTPEAIDTADFDGDGDMDLVVADSCLPQVRILWNDGAGGFDAVTDLSTWDPARTVLARDLDDDGDVDLVATEGGTAVHVLVFTNQAGAFTLAQRLLTNANGFDSDLADFDGDDLPELVLSARTNSSATEHGFYLYPNEGGSFGSPVFHFIGGSTSMSEAEVADFNGDHRLDVVGLFGGAMYFWLNDPITGLTLSGADGHPGVARIYAAQIDEDGFADRVLLRFGTQDVVLLLTTQSGPITLATYPAYPTEAHVVDLNGDGHLDLRIAADALYDYLRVPGGAFVAAGSHVLPGDSSHIVSADFDGDGAVDTAAASPIVDSLALVLSSGPSYASAQRFVAGQATDQDFADIDQDGDLDVVRASPSGSQAYRNAAGDFVPIGDVLPGARHARFVDLIPGGSPEIVLYSPETVHLRVCSASNGVDYSPLGAPIASTFGHSLASGDFDQDGLQDLFIGSAASVGNTGPINFLKGLGDGTFAPSSAFYVMEDPIAVRLADLDGDTDLDIVAATDVHFGGLINVLRNVDGTLAGPEVVANDLAGGGRFALGDVDRDGDIDIVAAASSLHELHVYANDGLGQFVRIHTLPLDREVLSMELALVDGDGALDLVTIETSSPMHVPGMIVVHRRGDGTGVFEIATRHAMGELGDRLVVRDLEGDGDVDVLLVDSTNPARDGVWVLENSGACSTGDALCAGDGSGAACPCGNSGSDGRGCANSFDANGAELSAAGGARVSSDSLTLAVSGLPPTTLVHFLQSEALENGGAGVAFGDGLLCVGGSIRRLAVRQANAGVAQLGAAEAQPSSLAALGQLPPAGGTRIYQARYRNVASFCTSATFNTSNALRVVWGD
ncbi:MAG: VCBS repeat-containing protein [Planctomycetes bacterium]|nr:VCBS repeat-containing protein [Planctomycetota bacterium]